jgi:hypothetical protein
MTEHEMDERFAVLHSMLLSVWNDDLPQVTGACASAHLLAQALAGTNEEEGAKRAFSTSIAQLRAYLRERSTLLVHAVDSFIQEAPCTSYSRIRYMDMLAGEPLAWGTEFDLNARARELCERISRKARGPKHLHTALFQRLESAVNARNEVEADEIREEVRKLADLEDMAKQLLKRPLLTELLRVLQHMDDARPQWEKAPVRAGNFRDLFGPDRFPKVEAAMRELGITPKPYKGKNEVVAAFHAACELYGLRLPDPGQWPTMLKATYPGTDWHEKSKAQLRPRDQGKGYKVAFNAVKDRLQ